MKTGKNCRERKGTTEMILSTSQHSSPVRDVVVRMAESDADIGAFRRHSKKYAKWIFDNFGGV